MQRSLTATLSLITLGLLTACGNDSMPIEEKSPMLIQGIRATASGEQIAAECDVALENAKAEFAILEAQTGPATVESVFGQYEKVGDALTLIGDVWHLRSVHPDAEVRDAANACSEKQSDFFSEGSGVLISQRIIEDILRFCEEKRKTNSSLSQNLGSQTRRKKTQGIPGRCGQTSERWKKPDLFYASRRNLETCSLRKLKEIQCR